LPPIPRSDSESHQPNLIGWGEVIDVQAIFDLLAE
jgi:hypothetical protein